MFWEYLILVPLIGWALFYLWRSFFKQKGCSCGNCPSACNSACACNKLGIVLPEERGCGEDPGEDEERSPS